MLGHLNVSISGRREYWGERRTLRVRRMGRPSSAVRRPAEMRIDVRENGGSGLSRVK
jgi:hypothetical protein